MKSSSSLLGASCAVAVLALASSRPAAAADFVWNAPGNGNWTTPSNWDPVSVPSAGDRVFLITIAQTPKTVTFNDPVVRIYNSILIDTNGAGLMSLTQPLQTMSAESMTVGAAGPAAYNLVAATGSFGSLSLGASGTISIDHGQIWTNSFIHAGRVNVPAGTINVTGVYTYNGLFNGNQNGSLITATANAGTFIANTGSFDGGLSITKGLTLNVPSLTIGGDFHNRGSIALTAGKSVGVVQDVFLDAGSINQDGGNFESTIVGRLGMSASTQTIAPGAEWRVSGGGANVGGFLVVGANPGNVNGVARYGLLGPGTCDFSGVTVGQGADAVFQQNDGTCSTNSLVVGAPSFPGRGGRYEMTGGSLDARSLAVIGGEDSAYGSFSQSGGVARFGGTLLINQNAACGRAAINLSGGTLIVTARTINHGTFAQSGGVATFNANLDGAGTVSVSGGDLFVTRLRQRAVSIGGTGLIAQPSGSYLTPPTHRVESLTFEPGPGNAVRGTWDISASPLVVDYSGASPIASIRKYLANGYAGGAWTGTGIRSSLASAPSSQHAVGIGYAEASSLPALANEFNTDSTALIVKPTRYGDTDLDEVVDFDDYVRTDNGFNNHLTGWMNGDFDYNGVVNFDDYVLIDLAFNVQLEATSPGATLGAQRWLAGEAPADGIDPRVLSVMQDHLDRFGQAYASAFGAAVPEPGAAGIAMCLGLAAHRIRRRRNRT